MVKKLEIQSPTVDVGNCLKRSSSLENCVVGAEAEEHSPKKAREVAPCVSTASYKSERQRNRLKRNLRVRFSPENEIFQIAKPTKEEKLDMHMTKEDQRIIIQEISDAIRRCNSDDLLPPHVGDDSDNKFIEEQGIQRILQQQELARVNRVRNAKNAILQRQQQKKLFRRSQMYYFPTEQREIINESWLEKHYRPFSKVSSDLARSRGLEDQEMAPYLTPRKMFMVR